MSTVDLDHLRQWVGKEETHTDYLSVRLDHADALFRAYLQRPPNPL